MNDKATTEFEIKVSGGRIIGENLPLKDGRYKVVAKRIVPENTRELTTEQNKMFLKVPASELSLDDEFMKHKPKTEKECKFKELVENAIKSGLKDFWRPICDPSFDKCGHICFVSGKKPATRQSYNWWKENAKKYAPECGSRLGTRTEYIALLAVLIKELIAFGKSVEWAWNAVCNDSKELVHYWNSENTKITLENTGSREVCGLFDFTRNTYKILDKDNEAVGFWRAGGFYNFYGDLIPLAVLQDNYLCLNDCYGGSGWIVFDSCPDC